MLMRIAEKCRQRRATGHTVWAFFNNDVGAHAPRDAGRLQEMRH